MWVCWPISIDHVYVVLNNETIYYSADSPPLCTLKHSFVVIIRTIQVPFSGRCPMHIPMFGLIIPIKQFDFNKNTMKTAVFQTAVWKDVHFVRTYAFYSDNSNYSMIRPCLWCLDVDKMILTIFRMFISFYAVLSMYNISDVYMNYRHPSVCVYCLVYTVENVCIIFGISLCIFFFCCLSFSVSFFLLVWFLFPAAVICNLSIIK